MIRAEFHYAIQVADLVADPVFDQVFNKFVQVCDQFSTGLRHAHAGLRPGRRPGLRLDSVMEFGLKQANKS